MTTQPVRTPHCHKIRYGVTGAPEIPIDVPTAPDVTMAPTAVEIRYLAPRGEQPAFVDATVRGYWMRGGERWQPEKELLHHFKNGPDGWPEWLAEEARLHDPQPAAPAAWSEDDPLMWAIARAVWEHCAPDDKDMPQLVLDDPRNIAAAAAAVVRAQATADQAALARVRTVLETEAVVGRSALEYRGLITSALMGVEAQPAETDEQRADREETERDHAKGDHTHCGPTCEVEYPTEQLRNFILAKGYPGTAGMLDELLRRAAVGALRG